VRHIEAAITNPACLIYPKILQKNASKYYLGGFSREIFALTKMSKQSGADELPLSSIFHISFQTNFAFGTEKFSKL
jgi:hypothetical protein